MTFDNLTQLALLGVERQSPAAPTSPPPIGDWLRSLDWAQKEDALLSAAALTSAHERAGRLPASDSAAPPIQCPADQLPQVSARARTLLRRLLEGEHPQLLHEWLQLAIESKTLASPELLPALLAKGATDQQLRAPVLAAAGERGRWLAAHNSEWSWVAGSSGDEAIWHTGDRPARAVFLRQQRATQTAEGLELLVSTWKEETPEDRAFFLAELEIGLSLNDESFLESALDDKRKEVRRVAAKLLARLPGAALVNRMVERANPLFKFTPGKPGGLLKLQLSKPPSLEVVLPDSCDKAMQRDGIEPKPVPGFGEKAWWLIQILEIVPLDLWTREWNVTHEEILSASLAGEWSKELLEAWTRAAISQQHSAWAGALFKIAVDRQSTEKFTGILLALPIPERESRIAKLLTRDDLKIRELHPALLAQCKHPWSLEFSRSVLDWMRRLTTQPNFDWTLRSQLKDFASNLSPAAFAEASQGWKTELPEWTIWSKVMDEFFSVIQFRSDLRAALPATH